MAETASEILFPLAESIASQPPFSSSPPSDTVLLSITDAFLLTLSNELRAEFTENKDLYLQLLARYLKRIYQTKEKKKRPHNLTFSSLLSRHLFQQLIGRFDQIDVSTILLSLRSGEVIKFDHLCAALLSLPSHSHNQDLSRAIALLVSAPLESHNDRSIRALACLHAFLLVSTPANKSLVSLLAVSHGQKPSFLTLIAFIALWARRFPSDDGTRHAILVQTCSLFACMARNLSKDLRPAKTDPLAIYLIRKWLQLPIATAPIRALAKEILQLLGQLESSFFGSSCPSLVLQTLSPQEALLQVRWEGAKGLLSRDDLEAGCEQSLIALVAPKGSKAEEDSEENPTEAVEERTEEGAEGGAEEVSSAPQKSAESEAEWRSLLRGKKTLKTKPLSEQDEVEESDANDGIGGDEEVGFVIDTLGDSSVFETEATNHQDEEVEEASAPLTIATPDPTPVPASEKKRPGRKRKEVAKEEREAEQEAEAPPQEETEAKTRKSRRVRK
jgi:hypothetical protein